MKVENGKLQGEVGEKIQNQSARIEKFVPTPENTKDYKVFNWQQVSRLPDIEVEAVMENGKPLGLIGTRLNTEDKKDYGALKILNLERAGVDKEGKGGDNKGVGKRLIQHAVQKAVKGGVDAVYLTPATTAIPYYKSLGFVEMGQYLVLEGTAFNRMKGKRE